MSPEGDLAEDARHSRRLVAPAQVRSGGGGIARRVEAAAAIETGHGVHGDRVGETVFATPAAREDRLADGPDELVEDGAAPSVLPESR